LLPGDEKTAAEKSCRLNEFRCNSGECIEDTKRCNRHYDCTDGSDEITCDYYVAATRYAQSHPNVVKENVEKSENNELANENSYLELSHRDEETVETAFDVECTDQEFRCLYLSQTVCVHYDKLCDGIPDCSDGSDEQRCESESAEETLKCTSNEFRCDSGQCISEDRRCDHKYDCQDGTDESTCEYFKAALRRQYHNEINNVQETEDEKNDDEKNELESHNTLENNEYSHRELEPQHFEGRRRNSETELGGDEKEQEKEQVFNKQVDNGVDEVTAAQDLTNSYQNSNGSDKFGNFQHNSFEPRRFEEDQRKTEFLHGFGTDHFDNLIIPADNRGLQYPDEYATELGENRCGQHEFACGDGECIDRQLVCDARVDCSDGLDEAQCHVANSEYSVFSEAQEPAAYARNYSTQSNGKVF
uniref:Basement membrane-specific heparan sulfate proteoglycan core protein n=1 Tax=Syphacia muris TaxID=451379 RepID=A0A0N5ABW0_9BILA